MECVLYTSFAVAIPFSYVGLLYYFDDRSLERNHPISIRQRFKSAFVNNLTSILITYLLLKWKTESPFEQMGFHFYGTIFAIVFPTFLTATCYLGTWVLMLLDGSWTEIFNLREWKISFQEWTWWRHIIVGPISEELAFRSCTAVLINYCFGWSSSLFISPLFFSLCHFHHIHNDLKEGATLSNAILQRAFQATYSYLFGVYATYLFLRTGHIFAPIFSHALCNGLGLPNIAEIGSYQKETRIKLWISYFVGLFLWIMLLDPLTTPILYQFL